MRTRGAAGRRSCRGDPSLPRSTGNAVREGAGREGGCADRTCAAARRRRLVAHRWREAATTTGMIERRRMNAPLTVASFGMELPAGHPGRNPLFNLSLQPTVVSWRLEGNCPRHSRRQSVVRDSPVRAQTSRHRRRRAGAGPACAGCSLVSVASSRTRAFLTQLMLRGAESRSQLLLIAPSDSLLWYPDRGDSLIFSQWVGNHLRSGPSSVSLWLSFAPHGTPTPRRGSRFWPDGVTIPGTPAPHLSLNVRYGLQAVCKRSVRHYEGEMPAP